MRVLGFDATSQRLTVGLAENGRSMGRWDEHGRRDRGNTLELVINRALAEAGWTRHDVDGLAIVTGPGSLTAIRIGWATASGWALAGGIPIAGWPVPEVQQRWWCRQESEAARGDHDLPTVCVVHHRGDEFYTYDLAEWQPGQKPGTVTLGDVELSLGDKGQLVGPGVIGYHDRWQSALKSEWEIVGDERAIVGGDQLARWGSDDLKSGRHFDLAQSPLEYGLQPEFRKAS